MVIMVFMTSSAFARTLDDELSRMRQSRAVNGRHFDCAHTSDRRELEDVQRPPAGTMSFFERFGPLAEDQTQH